MMPLYGSMCEMPYLDGLIFEWAQYSHLEWDAERHLKSTTFTPDEAREQLTALTNFLTGAGALPNEKHINEPNES